MSLLRQNYQSFLNLKKAFPVISLPNCNISRNFYQLNHTKFTFPTSFNSLLSKKENKNFSENKICFEKQYNSQQQKFYSTHSGKSCWNCKAVNKIEAIFCEKCHSVQILDPEIDYFSILGM